MKAEREKKREKKISKALKKRTEYNKIKIENKDFGYGLTRRKEKEEEDRAFERETFKTHTGHT